MRFLRIISIALVWLAMASCASRSTEPTTGIVPFRLTDVRGYTELTTHFNKDKVNTIGGTATEESTLVFQEEVAVQTRSYAYHPNLLTMDISGGLLLDQSSFDRAEFSNNSQDLAWNLSSQFNFLRKKPYPIRLFFEQNNPLATTGLAESFRQQNRSFGLNAALLQPFSPATIDLAIRRNTSQGEGTEQIVDKTTDSVSLSAARDFFPGSHSQITYQLTHQNSRSGSTNLPIQAIDTTDHTVDLVSSLRFGEDDKFQLHTVSTYGFFDDPKRLDFTYSPSFRWRHSDRFSSFYRYTLSTTKQQNADSTIHLASAGLNLRLSERLSGVADIHGNLSKDFGGFESRIYGVGGSINYSRPLSFGKLRLSHTSTYDVNEQSTKVNRLNVIGENLILTGTAPFTLEKTFGISQSVVVSNLLRTQTFIENVDYRLVEIGSRISIERLVGGSILDGQTVLVDYAFDPGGTFSYTLWNQSYAANLRIKRFYNLSARYQRLDQSLSSGKSSTPFNSMQTFEVGARADVPITRTIKVGGSASFFKQDEDIAPFVRQKYDAYVQFSLPYESTLNLSARRELTDNANSSEDTDQMGGSIRLSSRPWFGINLSSDLDYQQESGGAGSRSSWRGSLRASWQIRKLHLFSEAGYSRETQGQFEREGLHARFVLRRVFR